MKLNYITIMVRNLEKSLEFYKELALLNVVNQIELPIGKINFLSDGKDSTMLELIEFKNDEKVETKGMVMSFLVTEALENVHSKAVKLGYHPSDIINQDPKPKHFIVKDPDGIIIEFSERFVLKNDKF